MSTHKKYVTDLKQQAEKLYNRRPEQIRLYNDMVDYYIQGIDACAKYFKTLNILEFVKELDKSGFHKKIVSLKDYVQDPTTLNHIRESEEELCEIELIFQDGGISEGNI